MFNLLISESVTLHADTLKKIISEYNAKLNIYTASDFDSAKSIYKKHNINIFIIDISLPDFNCDMCGMRMAEELRRIPAYREVPIIFTADSYEFKSLYHAINSIHCFSYIIKPFNTSDIYKALNDIYKKYNFPSNDKFIIRDVDGIYIPLKKDSIIYIESSNHLTTFYTKDREIQSGRKCLTDILYMLDSRFIQSHKRYIVNTSYIKNYDKTNRMITIYNKHLPVGRSYKAYLDEILS